MKIIKKEQQLNIYLFRNPYNKDIYGFCRDFVNMTYYITGNREQGYETFYSRNTKNHNGPDKTFNI